MHSSRFSRIVLPGIVSGLVLLAAGCTHHHKMTWQGYVEGKYVYIAASESGRLDRLDVSRGDTVAPGHSLFALDHEPENSMAREAQEVLRSSESRLADLRTGKRPPEIAVTRAQLTEALAQQSQADAILRSDEAQYRSGGIPQTELINVRGAADVAGARVQELQANLAVDALPAREQQIRAQMQQVAAERAALAQAEWRLQQKEVASPRQGVVFDTLYREGEWIAAGNPVVELLPPENVEVRFFVPESILGTLHTGEAIRVKCDGCATPVPARITFISPQSEYTPPVIYSNENRSKLIFMIIAKPPVERAGELHPGQPVEVALE